MNEGVVSTFSASVELELKSNDETHRFTVNLEPYSSFSLLTTCSRALPNEVPSDLKFSLHEII